MERWERKERRERKAATGGARKWRGLLVLLEKVETVLHAMGNLQGTLKAQIRCPVAQHVPMRLSHPLPMPCLILSG